MDPVEDASLLRAKPGAWADNPWDHEHPVFKVGPGERGKIFAFLGGEGVGVKAATTREVADEWLHRYPGSASVMAYIGRSGWNDLAFDGRSPTTSCSRPSTSPTGWWSRSCRRSSAPTAGTPERSGLARALSGSSGSRPTRGPLRLVLRGLELLGLAPLQLLDPLLDDRTARLATTRSEVGPVGIGTKIGQTKPSAPAMNQIAQTIRLGIRNRRTPRAASRRSRAAPGARGRPRDGVKATGRRRR